MAASPSLIHFRSFITKNTTLNIPTMTKNRIAGILLSLFAAASLQEASAQPITLTGSSYTNTFDTMETDRAVPSGWTLYTGATASGPGSIAAFSAANYTASSNSWRGTTGRFANQASTFSYAGGTNFLGTETNNPVQWNEPNRCLALRQTGTAGTGGDPGGAFVLKIAETAGRKDFVLSLDFLNLDPTSPRTTKWTVDFGLGTTPSFFVPLATWANTPSNFTTYHTNISLPNGTIDNDSGPVWIRIVALSASTGSGNRETFAIDNFGLTWADGSVCTPVSIVTSPANATAYINGNQSFTVGALGTKPLNYTWRKNGSTVLTDDGHFGGTATPTLTITKVQPEDAGTYSCTVANECSGTPYAQTSGAATLTVATPPAVSIAYLHTLVSPSTWAPTNMSLLYQATGIITTLTNTTTANTASYYLQDGTGGINLFCTFGSTFRPSIGDVVTAIGFLSSFGGNLELYADLNNPAHGATTLSNNIAAYPDAKLVAWDNLYQFGTNATLNYNYQGAVVLLTNVYFGTNAGVVTTNGNYNLIVTNALGKLARVLLPAALDNDLTNRTIPAFAYAVRGPLIATTGGYQIMPTSWTEIVTTAPSITLDTPLNGASFTAPASIALSATVTTNGYDVSTVNFYNGAALIGSALTPPYTYSWNDVGAGTNALSAKAVYSLFGNSLSAASAVNTVTVTSTLAPVSSVRITTGEDNSLNISYAGGSASQFVLVGTNDITAPVGTWPVIQTTNGTTPATFNIPTGSATQMYYKIKSQ